MSALSCEGVADASEAIDMLPIEDSDTELAPVTGRPPGPAALREVVCITAAKPEWGGPTELQRVANPLVRESRNFFFRNAAAWIGERQGNHCGTLP